MALLLFTCALATILTTLGIMGVLSVETIRFFRVSGVGIVEFLTGAEIDFEGPVPKFGVLPLAWGTLVIALGSSIVALPVGLASAIFLSEYAPRGLRTALKPTLELLAGIPTIVYGYLALTVVTPWLQTVLMPLGIRVETFNAFSGCLVVGIMIIPLVSSLSEDVLSSVPSGLREAAYGLRRNEVRSFDQGRSTGSAIGRSCFVHPGDFQSHRRDHGGGAGSGQLGPNFDQSVYVGRDHDGLHRRDHQRRSGGRFA